LKDGTLALNDNVGNAAVSNTIVVGDGFGAAGRQSFGFSRRSRFRTPQA